MPASPVGRDADGGSGHGDDDEGLHVRGDDDAPVFGQGVLYQVFYGKLVPHAFGEHDYEGLVVEYADAVVMCEFLVVHKERVNSRRFSEDADVEIMVGDVAYWVRGPCGGRTISPWNFGSAKTISYLVEGGRTLGGCRGSRVRYWVRGVSAC